MKKRMLFGGLLLGAALLIAPAAAAQAKELAAGESIPLTEEYFPDEWFLNRAQTYDTDADGELSPEEAAAVTQIYCSSDLSDFSQLQYFTNLKKLDAQGDDGDGGCGVWLGGELDLTVFPELEEVSLLLDSAKMPADLSAVQIEVSGLTQLTSVKICDASSGSDDGFDGANAAIGVIDLRGTPSLESVSISDAKGVIFDDEAQVSSIYLCNISDIKAEQIGGFSRLQELVIRAELPELTGVDVSENKQLKTLELYDAYLEEVKLAGADALETLCIEADALTGIDVSENVKLTKLRLVCPGLKALDVKKNTRLAELRISSDSLTSVNVKKNTALTTLEINCNQITSLNVAKNTKLTGLYVEAKKLTKLNVKKNTKLKQLALSAANIKTLDLSANKKLVWLDIYNTSVKTLDLSKQKKLTQLYLRGNKKLDSLDLSANTAVNTLHIDGSALETLDLSKLTTLKWLELENNKLIKTLDLSKNKKLSHLKINGSTKLTRLDLTKNKKLSSVDVSANKLKTLTFSASASYLTYLDCRNNKLTTLDLSGVTMSYPGTVYCDQGVEVVGYDGEVNYE